MASWRDTASQLAQDDLDGLLNTTLPFAQQMIEKLRAFYPFGASVTSDGETRLVAGDSDGSEHPPSQAVLETILQGFRGSREALRAVAICSDVRLSDVEAARIELEHREGQAIA